MNLNYIFLMTNDVESLHKLIAYFPVVVYGPESRTIREVEH